MIRQWFPLLLVLCVYSTGAATERTPGDFELSAKELRGMADSAPLEKQESSTVLLDEVRFVVGDKGASIKSIITSCIFAIRRALMIGTT